MTQSSKASSIAIKNAMSNKLDWSGFQDYDACHYEPEQEQNEIKDLQMQLSETTSLVKTLSQQLGELRDKVNTSTHL